MNGELVSVTLYSLWDEEASRISVVFTDEGFVEVVFENDAAKFAWTLPKRFYIAPRNSTVHVCPNPLAAPVRCLSSQAHSRKNRILRLRSYVIQSKFVVSKQTRTREISSR